MVLNPNQIPAWTAAFAASTKTLAAVWEHAPRTNGGIDVCLSWHLRGQCVKNCPRVRAHRRLQAQETERMAAFVTAQLQPP